MIWGGVLVVMVVALCHRTQTCNYREISRIVEDRFRKEATSSCGSLGDKCTFDRDCCEGMECKMSANAMGVDNYCEPRVVNKVEENIPLAESRESPVQPSSPEDGDWMLASKSDSIGGREGGKYLFSTLDQIDDLQERKRVQLVKENEDLGKLFTDRDERELEQLRSLKEDAEIDELRRLKELKLKRKLDLLREIQELRGLKAQNDLDRFDQLRDKTTHAASVDSSNITMDEDGGNTTVGLEEEEPSHTESPNPINSTFIDTDSSLQPKEKELKEVAKTKYKQGIRHRKKHHQPKHKKKPRENRENSTLS